MKKEILISEKKQLIESLSKYEGVLVIHNFSASIKNIMDRSGCSQNQIARAIDVDKSTLSKMINRERKLKKIDILRICKFLKVPSDISIELFDYNGTTIKTNKEEDILIYNTIFSEKNVEKIEALIKLMKNK